MSTPMRKQTTRETVNAYSSAGGRKLIVTIGSGDVLTIREKGRRTAFSLSIEGFYYLAVEAELRPRKREKRHAREGRKQATK